MSLAALTALLKSEAEAAAAASDAAVSGFSASTASPAARALADSVLKQMAWQCGLKIAGIAASALLAVGFSGMVLVVGMDVSPREPVDGAKIGGTARVSAPGVVFEEEFEGDLANWDFLVFDAETGGWREMAVSDPISVGIEDAPSGNGRGKALVVSGPGNAYFGVRLRKPIPVSSYCLEYDVLIEASGQRSLFWQLGTDIRARLTRGHASTSRGYRGIGGDRWSRVQAVHRWRPDGAGHLLDSDLVLNGVSVEEAKNSGYRNRSVMFSGSNVRVYLDRIRIRRLEDGTAGGARAGVSVASSES